ncbi:hypothetical protein JCM1840_000776 [Sporobolomyces johnsonii]
MPHTRSLWPPVGPPSDFASDAPLSTTRENSNSQRSTKSPRPRLGLNPHSPASDPPQDSAFELYDPRGLGARVRQRSRSSTPHHSREATASEPGSESPVPTSPPQFARRLGHDRARVRGADENTSRALGIDEGGDTRMRAASEEPTLSPDSPPSTSLSFSAAAPIPLPSHPNHPSHPTPSSPSSAHRQTPQRVPSLRAREAFNRLRIGSFGSSPPPSSSLASPPPRTLSPDDLDRGQAQLSRSDSIVSSTSSGNGTGTGTGQGMSPAASFLSSFSPPSAAASFGARGMQPLALPPKGDEAGYVLPLSPGETEDEGEWVLGQDLGQGGMGIVREGVWRRRRPSEATEAPKRRDRVAVKIVRRNLLSSPSGRAAAGSALEAFGFAEGPRSPTLGTRAASFGQNSLPLNLRNPSRDRLVAPTPSTERCRSTSSPIRPSGLLSPFSRFGLSTVEQSPLPTPGVETPGPVELPEQETEQSLLDLLLQRELDLWGQITSLSLSTASPASSSTSAAKRPPQPHRHLVPLLSTIRTTSYDYILMPLCSGGSLLSYLNAPPSERDEPPPDSPSPTSTPSLSNSSSAGSDESSQSRSRERSGSSSYARGRSRKPVTRTRASLPFATTSTTSALSPPSLSPARTRLLSPPPSSSHEAPPTRGLPLPHAGHIFAQIVDGLEWLHTKAGVVHKDLKLENVLSCWEEEDASSESDEGNGGEDVEMEGEEGQATTGKRQRRRVRVWKIADFGLAEIIPSPSPARGVKGVQPLASLSRAGSLSRPLQHNGHHSPSPLSASVGPASHRPHPLSSSSVLPPLSPSSQPSPTPSSPDITAHLHPLGSLPYSSPESLRSAVPLLDPSVDVWALGCVLYALVEGRLPIWDEWEFRLRARLVRGEWDVPLALAPTRAGQDEGSREEREMCLEVLRGCLEKDVARRWTVSQVATSPWLAAVRAREAHERDQRRLARKLATAPTPLKPEVVVAASPGRGRPITRSAAAAAAAALVAHASASVSPSSSRSVSRPRSMATAAAADRAASTPRRPSRSTSRSSAYAHQGVSPATQELERRERGRSERRLRWDEEKERRRSASRSQSVGGGGGGDEARGRSASRGGARGGGVGKGSKSRERGGKGLETVGEPY